MQKIVHGFIHNLEDRKTISVKTETLGQKWINLKNKLRKQKTWFKNWKVDYKNDLPTDIGIEKHYPYYLLKGLHADDVINKTNTIAI